MQLKCFIIACLFIIGTPFVKGETSFNEDFFKVNLTNSPHELKLLNSGLSSLEQRLEMIENAEKSIDVEYFIYNADKSGKIFTQALVKKARQGVKVRLLLDSLMGSGQITPFHIHELKKEGIEVKYYNPISALNLFNSMYRNHRKVLIVDGQEVLTGGRNIGDEYFYLREDFNFLDRDIYLKGEIAKKILNTFNIIWDSKISVFKDREAEPNQYDFKYRRNSEDATNNYEQDLDLWRNKVLKAQKFITESNQVFESEIRKKGKELLAQEYVGSCDNVRFSSEFPIANRSSHDVRIIKYDILNRIQNAKENILIESPYFIVNEEAKTALHSAITKNVQIDVLTNGLNSTDAVHVFDVFATMIKDWIQKGFTVYMFKGEKPVDNEVLNESFAKSKFGIHAKTFVIDKKDVVIGTFNFDSLSANYNVELTIACENNPEFAKVVTENIQNREEVSIKLDTSEKFDENQFFKVSFFKRLESLFLAIPSNIFSYLL